MSNATMAAKVVGSVGAVLKSRAEMSVADAEGDNGADSDADECEPHGARDDAELHACRGGAERHADADLERLPRDGVGDDAIDAERGEQQAERGEAGDEHHEESARRDGVIDERLDGTQRHGGLFRIDLAQGVHDAGGELRGRKRAADDELCAFRALLA